MLGYKSVKHGFNWLGFFFPIIWAAVNKFWVLAIGLLIASQIVSGFFTSQMNPYDSFGTQMKMLLFFHAIFFDLPIGIYIGATGNSKVRVALQKRGYKLLNEIEADSCEGAIALNIDIVNTKVKSDELINSKFCPFCAESIKKEAKACKHCGRDVPAYG